VRKALSSDGRDISWYWGVVRFAERVTLKQTFQIPSGHKSVTSTGLSNARL